SREAASRQEVLHYSCHPERAKRDSCHPERAKRVEGPASCLPVSGDWFSSPALAPAPLLRPATLAVALRSRWTRLPLRADGRARKCSRTDRRSALAPAWPGLSLSPVRPGSGRG